MARLVPHDAGSAAASPGEAAEHETLHELARRLPDAYTIFHGVYWADEDHRRSPVGEIDFVVVNQSGDVLLVEQKAGTLRETDEGLVKDYGEDRKRVVDQIHRAVQGVKNKWKQAQRTTTPLDVGYLLYLPHYRVGDVNAAGLSSERIVDAANRDGLAACIEATLGEGIERDAAAKERVLGFFRQQVQVVPTFDHTLDTQQRVYERLSEGLVRLGERLDMPPPWRLRVVGRAGSGKSQLALRTVERAVERGRNTLYVCFNRPLADRGRAMIEGATVDTFQGLCRRLLENHGATFDLARVREPGFWAAVEEQVAELVVEAGPAFETVVVDEGQDFLAEWYEILRLCMADDAELLWVEDPLQALGGQPTIELDGFVTYATDENHRSPPPIIRALDKWLDIPCSSSNDLATDAVTCHTYRDADEQQALLDERVRALVEHGYGPEDLVVLTVHGFGKSVLTDARSVGGYPLRRFTGDYTQDGRQIYTRGRVFFDSVYRFKGQQAPAVILTDIDFPDWRDERARRVLYAGMTRARLHLELHYQA